MVMLDGDAGLMMHVDAGLMLHVDGGRRDVHIACTCAEKYGLKCGEFD